MMIKAIIFDAFGTLFKVTSGDSARKIISNIVASGNHIDEQAFIQEWKEYYKIYTAADMDFKTERDIFISRIRMFYNRYNVERNAEIDTDFLLANSYERDVYEEVPAALKILKNKYKIYIGSNTDNDVLNAVMKKNNITVDKIYTSENLKCYKPNPEFYLMILRDNNLSPHEVIFIGDSIDDDILGLLG
ncbi:MAG: HAD family hydrolase [Lachnospiraceae bacterium]|nr:HAD family hydrolase [Lachnospiraceae bacterium]